jgi:hypothetical protein
VLGPLPEETRCSYFLLGGDEAEAEVLLERELDRIERELDEEGKVERKPEEKVFTLYLMPEGGPTADGEWVPIHLPWANADLLSEMVWAEVESLYCEGGRTRVDLDHLRDSVSRSSTSHLLGRFAMNGVPQQWYRGNGGPLKQEDVSTAARAVTDACTKAVRVLDSRIDAAVKQIPRVAETLAVGRMKIAREEIEAERAKYLDLSSFGEVGRNVHRLLSGPGTHDLLAALRDVHRVRRRLEDASATYNARSRDVGRSIPQASPLPQRPVTLSDLVRAEYPDAASELVAATEALAMAMAVYGRRFPILFRIWNGPEIPTDVQPRPRGGLDSDTWEGKYWIKFLFNQIWWTLEEAQKANGEIVAKLESDPELVWKYPPAISAALEKLGFGYPSVEARVAQDKVTTALGRTPPWAKVCMVANAVEGVAWVTMAAPPTLIALACISLVVGVISTVEQFLEESRKEAAFKAVLDPGKALSGEPDYSGVLVGVLFSLLALKGVRDAMSVAKAAREVSFAQIVFTAVAVEQAVVAVAED